MKCTIMLVATICLCLLLSSCRQKADTVIFVNKNGVYAKGTVTFTRGSDGKYGPNAWQPRAIAIFRVDRTIEGESGQAGMVYLINKDRKLEKIGKADLNKTDDDIAAEYLKSDSREGQTSQSAPGSSPQSKAIEDQKSDRQDKEEGSSTPSEQIIVSIHSKETEIAEANPRFIEASSPSTVGLMKATRGSLSLSDWEVQYESPPRGMKWVIATIEFDPITKEMSLPIKQIRLVDESKRKKYRLISIGNSIGNVPFNDFREYDKFSITPPELVLKSMSTSRWNMLFAVSATAKGLILEL